MRPATPHPAVHRVRLLLLFASHTFFLWMFLASEALERTAEAGRFSGCAGCDLQAMASNFAARWRHGMTDGWLLFMPGFFAAAVATWFWSGTRPPQRRFLELAAVMILATVSARLLAPLGSLQVLEGFGRESGFKLLGPPLGSTPTGALLGLLTLATWTAFLLASQQALAKRSLWPMWAPAAFAVILAVARPMTFDDLVLLWARQVMQNRPVALLSLFLVLAVGAVLVAYQLRGEHRSLKGKLDSTD
jgi:hypothetical protein